MSGYTNAVTNITDESQYYVYPMAASLRGGAVESEYNIRNLMTCLFNKSAAKQDEDFIVYYNKLVDKQKPTLETYYESSNWYRIDAERGTCEIMDLAVSPGEGNCNGYYIRLQDFTPINNTTLNITNLTETLPGFAPVLPADLEPSLPVAKNIFENLNSLIDAESKSLIGKSTYPEPDADYVIDNKYKDGTSVRVKLDSEGDTYVHYTKFGGNWVFTSEIVAIYSVNAQNTPYIANYRIYKDGKYFKKNPDSGDIEVISFKDSKGADISIEDTVNGLKYCVLPGDITLYKVDVSYQNFNIILGLNWTVNQLVSSAQITICEDTTPIKYVTETDLDGDTTQYAYTEYGYLNKTLRDRGLLDAGIVLGTIRIKKTPVFSETSAGNSYSYRYSCTYEGNRYKTACIDLAKLGTDTDNLGENMYDKIARLFNLMIDSGSFKIGTVFRNSGFDTNPDSINHNFKNGIAPYRLDLGISDFETGVGQNYINGYLRFINYDEETNRAIEELSGYIFKCRVKVDSLTGQVTGLESLTFYNDTIECFDDKVTFNNHVNIGSNETGKRRNLFVSGETRNIGLIKADGGLKIGSSKTISFVGSSSTLSADSNGLKTDKFTVTANMSGTNITATSSFTVPQKTDIPTGEESLYDGPTIEIIPGRVKINTKLLDINSTEGTITTAGDISTTGNVTGNKVYGAVWM